jgi:hypothetical protein
MSPEDPLRHSAPRYKKPSRKEVIPDIIDPPPAYTHRKTRNFRKAIPVVMFLVVLGAILGGIIYQRYRQSESLPESKQVRETSFNGNQQRLIQNILDEIGISSMYSLYELDLNGDGKNEAIITYIAGNHSSGAKVVEFTDGKAEIIFDHGSSTPNTEFEIESGVATFSFEESTFDPDYATGERISMKYIWNGKEFEENKKR